MPRPKRIDPNQMSLFDALKREQEEQLRGDHPGDLDCRRVLRCALSEAVKVCPLNRFEIGCQSALKIDPPPASNFDPPQGLSLGRNFCF